jgi:hypothetical protein
VGGAGTFSHKKCTKIVFCHSAAAFVAKALLGARLKQTELGIVETHFGADLLLGLFEEVEAGENFAVPAGTVTENLLHDPRVLGPDGGFLGADVAIGDADSAIDVELIAAPRVDFFDEIRDLAADDRADKPHQAFWFAKFTALNRLDHNDKCVMDAVVDILTAQLADDHELDAAGEEAVELLEGSGFVALDTRDKLMPVNGLSGIGRSIGGDWTLPRLSPVSGLVLIIDGAGLIHGVDQKHRPYPFPNKMKLAQ